MRTALIAPCPPTDGAAVLLIEIDSISRTGPKRALTQASPARAIRTTSFLCWWMAQTDALGHPARDRRNNLQTVRSFLLRGDFQRFWTCPYAGWSRRFLRQWCTRTLPMRIEPMRG